MTPTSKEPNADPKGTKEPVGAPAPVKADVAGAPAKPPEKPAVPPESAQAKTVTEALKRVTEMHSAQFTDRNVYTEPYLTGIANGLLMAIGTIKSIDVTEGLLKPITQVAIKGAKVLTGRQMLIKQASKYVTMRGGTGALRSGLSPEDIEMADKIMKALSVKKGTYIVPAE